MDITDPDSRGVNDPAGSGGDNSATNYRGRSRPEYHHNSMSRVLSGRQKAPPLSAIVETPR